MKNNKPLSNGNKPDGKNGFDGIVNCCCFEVFCKNSLFTCDARMRAVAPIPPHSTSDIFFKKTKCLQKNQKNEYKKQKTCKCVCISIVFVFIVVAIYPS